MDRAGAPSPGRPVAIAPAATAFGARVWCRRFAHRRAGRCVCSAPLLVNAPASRATRGMQRRNGHEARKVNRGAARRLRGEDGASMIIAMAFLIVFALVLTAVL